MKAMSAAGSNPDGSLPTVLVCILIFSLCAVGCASFNDGFAVMAGAEEATAVHLNNRAVKAAESGRAQEAIDLYTRAINLSPNRALFRINRGLTYEGQGRTDEAYADFMTAKQLDPSAVVEYGNLGAQNIAWIAMNLANRAGQSLVAQGNYAKAVDWFTAAINADANNPAPRYNRALCHYRLNDLPGAWADFNAYLAINPRYEPLVQSDGLLLLDDRRIKDLSTAESAGAEAESRGDVASAFQHYSRAYALSDPIFEPDGGSAKRSREALIRVWQSAVVKPSLPESARRYQVQSEAHAKAGQYASVADTCGKVIVIAPWFPTAYFNCALALAHLDRYADASAVMQGFIHLAPEDPAARRAQDKIYEWQMKATAPPVVESQPAVAGTYQWFNGGLVTITSGGSVLDQGGSVVGAWVYDSARGLYVINWNNGQFIDTLSLSPDGQTLRGKNQFGFGVSGKRL